MVTKEEVKNLTLMDDTLFKEALTHPDNRNILKYFLSCFLDLDMEYLKKIKMEVNYESELRKSKYQDKKYRSDVLIVFEDYLINLECYKIFNLASLNKSINYAMRIFSTSNKAGYKKYNKLKQLVQINIVDKVETRIPKKIESIYKIINEDDLSYTILKENFKIKIYRLDIEEARKYTKSEQKVRWLNYLKARGYEERKRASEGDEYLMSLNEWLEKYVNDEQTKEFYGKWAEEIAIDKGKNEEKKELAKRMLTRKYKNSDIQEITGLSLKTINELQKEI